MPVLAEATVLLFGMHGLSWRRFLPPVLLANLGLAIAYSAVRRNGRTIPVVAAGLAVSIALPVLMVAAFRAWTSRTEPASTSLPSSLRIAA